MKVNQIMEYFFLSCSIFDTIRDAALKIVEHKAEFLIVVDERGRYFGLLTSSIILENYINEAVSSDTPISELALRIPAIKESDFFRSLPTRLKNPHIIPVINQEHIPVGLIRLKDTVDKYLSSLNSKRLGNHTNDRNGTKYTIDDIIGESFIIQKLKQTIIKVAKSKSTVLILGETGVGKELTAHAIVNLGNRRFQPFSKVNCAAIPDNLLESELFGYEPGAFTGASKTGAQGKFEIANNGTLFLDEIGDMKLMMQGKILRVLQEKEIEKIGGHAPIPIDVRIIAATHSNLAKMVESNLFRRDLFYRLNVIPIQIPPLRSHKEDIPMLIDNFVNRISDEMEIQAPEVLPEYYSMMQEYDWPGNIRELRNAVEMALSFSDGRLDRDSFDKYLLMCHQTTSFESDNETISINPLKNCVYESERETLIEYLHRFAGNKKLVSDALGISRSTLYYKLKKLNIEDF